MTRAGRRPHYSLTHATLLLAALAFSLLQSTVAPALLVIQRDLDISTTTATWVLTVNLLTASVATPFAGRLGDMFGKRRVLMCSLGALTLGTLVSALATSVGVLIVGRGIQGLGGALFPLSYGIIRDEFPKQRVATGIATISSVVGIGATLGIVMAGPITDHLSYHWLFWLPLGPIALATFVCYLVVPESPASTRGRVDWLGAVLLSGWLVGLLLGVSEGARWGWTSGRILGLYGASALVLVAWVALETRVREPLVAIPMMRLRGIWTTNVATVMFGFGMFGAFVLVPQFVQMPESTGYGFGASVSEAGLVLVPMMLGMLASSALAGRLANAFGPKLPLVLGSLLTTMGLGLLAAAHAEPWQFYVDGALLGTGMGFAFASMANQIMEVVPGHQTGIATGMNAIFRSIGNSFGAQVSGAIVAASIVGSLPTERGFTVAFTVSAAGAAVGTLAALAVPSRASAAVPATASAAD